MPVRKTETAVRVAVRALGGAGVGGQLARDPRLCADPVGIRRARPLAPEHRPAAVPLVQVHHGRLPALAAAQAEERGPRRPEGKGH